MKAPKILVFLLSIPLASGLELGNDPNGGGGLDGWSSIMVIDETSTYTNTSGNDELITPTGFDVQIGANQGRVTPFIVKVNGNDNFTVLAIGQTRISGTDYSSTGVFEYDFGTTPQGIILAPGEKLAAGMTNANPNGSANSGPVIPFKNSGNQIWLTGGSGSSATGSLAVGSPPSSGSSTLTNLSRTYAYTIDIDIAPASNDPPSDIHYSGEQPLEGLPIGSLLGAFTSIDPNPLDTHTYTLAGNPGSRYALSDNSLETALATGSSGSSTTIRVRSTDTQNNSFEKDFILIVENQEAPTALSLDATSVNALAAPGAPIAQLSTADPNSGDQFSYALVSGKEDDNNSLFQINENILSLATSIPSDQSSVTFRVQVTDLGGNMIEQSFMLPVLEPSVQINEFAASNNALLDEDGDSPDW
ncbi:hypothetical protein OAL23_01395, partial [bacterium]|nr:hypothetical protein [bacterium]